MATAKVYRPDRNWKGEIDGAIQDYHIGDVTGVIVGGATPQPLARFPGIVSTEGQLGIPYEQDSEVVVQQHDILEISGGFFRAVGPRMWEEDHVFAEVPDVVDDYYWIQVDAHHGRGR